jgi:probable F420-dependent oxidoreductase
VATGIANIRIRDPLATLDAAHTLHEAYPDRFILGLGTSHPALLGIDQRTDKPLTVMRQYLDAVDGYTQLADIFTSRPPRVLAALQPGMQRLALERTEGIHTFCVPTAHTAAARQRLGRDALIIPEQAVVLDADPTTARATARDHLCTRLGLPNYVNSFTALGYSEDDLAEGGSDRLVDDLVAWGDPAAVAARITEHLDAGADHVAIHPTSADLTEVHSSLKVLAQALRLPTRGSADRS